MCCTKKLQLFIAAFGFVCCVVLPPRAACAAMQAAEYEIKAVYLYNFLLFITWPDTEPDRPVVIGILGRDFFQTAFEKVEGTQVKSKGRQLQIRRFGSAAEKTDLQSCDALFISRSEKEHFHRIIDQVAGFPVLTVSDAPGFLEAGGMFNFVTAGDRIRWEVNRAALDKAGLRPSSQLLQSAIRVINPVQPAPEHLP